jgi:hypothetical protein
VNNPKGKEIRPPKNPKPPFLNKKNIPYLIWNVLLYGGEYRNILDLFQLIEIKLVMN